MSEGYDEDGNFYRTPVRRTTAYRDQYIMGVRQFVPVQVWEYENGDLLEGAERCQHVLDLCSTCGADHDCEHQKVRRCGRRAWFISRRYGHTVCERHRTHYG